MRKKTVIVPALFMLLLISCSSGGGDGGSSGGGGPSGIGPSGGVATSSDGRASVSIPAGALFQDTAIAVGIASSLPGGTIGTAYDLSPGGTTFSQPVTISITYDETSLPLGVTESSLTLGSVTNSQWTAVANATVDTVANIVSGTTTHFSVYGVIACGTGSGASIFCATGSMSTDRVQHTATLLSTGRVLVAGGFSVFVSGTILSNAEIYDPTTGTFGATGNMTVDRHSHAATLLTTGKVLVAGGVDSVNSLASAELYDASTGTFSATGSMTTARFHHTATLLPNGKVLVVGGFDGVSNGTFGETLPSAEIYDPTTGTFAATGSMINDRAFHTATVLPSGLVLVAGGYSSNTFGAVSGAELYDPTSGTFISTGDMTTDRSGHMAALLLTGKVLVAGGHSYSAGTNLATVELYDPTTGIFSSTGDMTTNRVFAVTTLLPTGAVLVTGGAKGGLALTSAELYDPISRTFSTTGNMIMDRIEHTATLLSTGRILVTGGHSDRLATGLASAELYQP